LTSASTRSSASSTYTRLSALALVLNVAGSPALAPGRLLLRSVATLAVAVAVLAPLALPVAVAVLAPLALALSVAVLAGERARRRHARRVGLGLLGLPATMVLR
jgi:hypothetical protein